MWETGCNFNLNIGKIGISEIFIKIQPKTLKTDIFEMIGTGGKIMDFDQIKSILLNKNISHSEFCLKTSCFSNSHLDLVLPSLI